MAYINIDIEDHLNEVDSTDLVEELQCRAKRKKQTIHQYIKNIYDDQNYDDQYRELSLTDKIAIMLGLNHLASKEEIIQEFTKL